MHTTKVLLMAVTTLLATLLGTTASPVPKAVPAAEVVTFVDTIDGPVNGTAGTLAALADYACPCRSDYCGCDLGY